MSSFMKKGILSTRETPEEDRRLGKMRQKQCERCMRREPASYRLLSILT